MLGKIFQSIRKSIKLRKVSKKLSKPFNLEKYLKYVGSEKHFNDLTSTKKRDSLDDLIDICYSDKNVIYVIEYYNIDRKVLTEIYDKLVLAGAGQYAGGHLVAASSLVYPSTLHFLLEHYKNGVFSIDNMNQNNSTQFISHTLIKYFEKGELGEVRY